jgi:hypothetical protein
MVQATGVSSALVGRWRLDRQRAHSNPGNISGLFERHQNSACFVGQNAFITMIRGQISQWFKYEEAHGGRGGEGVSRVTSEMVSEVMLRGPGATVIMTLLGPVSG